MDHQTTNILLIEDNPGDADLVRLRLVEGKTPVNVNCVNRLSDGLASLSRETPSVVLLDLNLPDSRGAETFRRVMEHAPHVPVVVLSVQDDEVLAMKAMHQGVQDYLIKIFRASTWSAPSVMRWNGRRSCAPSKSLKSSNWSSRTASSPTSHTNCARR
jgi:DNA-binding response OmpR family regulator